MSALSLGTVPKNHLMQGGPTVSALSLGSWNIFDRMAFEEAVTMVRTAIDAGINLFDVGVYLGNNTDVLFSTAINRAGVRRQDYLFCTKIWIDEYPEKALGEQVRSSLFRGGVERAELGLVGVVRRDDLDMERLVADLGELHSEGLLGAWGVTNWSAANLHRAFDLAERLGVPGPCVTQLKYSIVRRSVADGPEFSELFSRGLRLQAADVMEGGILIGRDGSGRPVGRDPGNIRAGVIAAAEPISKLAEELSCSPSQLCIAFALSHPYTASVLFGASSTAQLQENLGALDLLTRVGADRLRELVAEWWLDRNVVDSAGGMIGERVGDGP